MKKLLIKLMLALSFMAVNNINAEEARYFMCGPDEDGCMPGQEQYCACVPYNTEKATKPYCLEVNERRCAPLSEQPDCYYAYIYKNQGECLASLFQSMPRPLCPVVTKSFCELNRAYICGVDGYPGDCKHDFIQAA